MIKKNQMLSMVLNLDLLCNAACYRDTCRHIQDDLQKKLDIFPIQSECSPSLMNSARLCLLQSFMEQKKKMDF